MPAAWAQTTGIIETRDGSVHVYLASEVATRFRLWLGTTKERCAGGYKTSLCV